MSSRRKVSKFRSYNSFDNDLSENSNISGQLGDKSDSPYETSDSSASGSPPRTKLPPSDRNAAKRSKSKEEESMKLSVNREVASTILQDLKPSKSDFEWIECQSEIYNKDFENATGKKNKVSNFKKFVIKAKTYAQYIESKKDVSAKIRSWHSNLNKFYLNDTLRALTYSAGYTKAYDTGVMMAKYKEDPDQFLHKRWISNISRTALATDEMKQLQKKS